MAATIQSIISTSTGLVNSVVVLLIGLALLYFVWGIVEFIGNSGNEEKRAEGKQRMLWGVIALFVIVSVWGLVAVIRNTFLGNSNSAYGTVPPPPQF